ncbi:MAG: hypothetical protein J6U21_04725 [Bacteroidales bacterium]|nr:hypothetical protein [Bacteroidales bacterium]
MKRVYDEIAAALEKHAAQFDILGVNPPETFDIHLGQPQNPDQFEFALPAVFYDYSVDFSAEYLYVYIHAVQEFEDDTECFAAKREPGERFFLFLTALKRCLNNLKIPHRAFGKLCLYQEQPQNSDFYYHHLLTFRCLYKSDLDDDLYPAASAKQYTLDLKRGRLKTTLAQ